MIRALLRAQWLSMRFSSGRSAWTSLVLAALWYGFWTLLSLVAEEVAATSRFERLIITWLPAGLLAISVYWQLAPMASGAMGGSLDLRKLLIYPVPRGSLFFVELLLRITTCAELLLLLTGITIGLLRNPAFDGLGAAARIPMAVILFAAFNLILAAGLRSLLERLLTRRGIREIIGLLLMLLGVLPRLLMVTGVGGRRLERVLPTASNLVWPWGAAAHFMLLPTGGTYTGAAVLVGWSLAAYYFARWQFERNLRFDFQAAQAATVSAKDRSFTDRLYRLPALLLPDPVAAIVEKELRSFARTPRFRMVFVMGFSFGLVVWLPTMLRGRITHNAVSSNFLTVVSLYALFLLAQVTYGNSFGFDRSAAQLFYLAPISISRAVAGKNIAAAIVIFAEVAAIALACSILRLDIPLGQIGEAFAVTAIAALYLLSVGNLSSVNYARPMSAQRATGAGSARRSQGLLLLLYPIAMLPVFLAFLARYAFDSQTVFYAALALAAALGIAVYWMAMESTVTAAYKRREAILAQLSGGEGPLVAD